MGSEEEMIHDHNDKKLGGPNADVIERIEALKRPKLVQADALCSYCNRRHPTEIFELSGMRVTTCPDVPPDEIRSVSGPAMFPSQVAAYKNLGYGRNLEFPPKHIYEPVTDERRAEIIKALEGEPMPDYSHTITTTGAIPDFGEKRKFL